MAACEEDLIVIDQEMLEPPSLDQADANQRIDSTTRLASDSEPTGEFADNLNLNSSRTSSDISQQLSIPPTHELINSASITAENESETDEDGESPLSAQPNLSYERRRQNAKFHSWLASVSDKHVLITNEF